MQPQPRESPVQDSPVQAQAPQVQPAQEQAGSGSQPALKPAATAKTRAAPPPQGDPAPADHAACAGGPNRQGDRAEIQPAHAHGQPLAAGDAQRVARRRHAQRRRLDGRWAGPARRHLLRGHGGLAQDADRNSAAGEGEEPSHHRRPAGDQKRPPPQAAWRCAARPGDQRGAGITRNAWRARHAQRPPRRPGRSRSAARPRTWNA